MTTWQDLKDDLDNMGERGDCMDCIVNCPPHRLARRVLALYEPCTDCTDGTIMWAGVPDMCSRCSGTGFVPSGEWPDWRGNGPTIGARGLFRYLFGEGDS